VVNRPDGVQASGSYEDSGSYRSVSGRRSWWGEFEGRERGEGGEMELRGELN